MTWPLTTDSDDNWVGFTSYTGSTFIKESPTPPFPIRTLTLICNPRAELFKELQELANEACRDDWDGEGSHALTPDGFKAATRFVRSLPENVVSPDISLDRQGRVHFAWDNGPDDFLGVAIDQRGVIYFASFVGGNRFRGVIEDFSEHFPDGLLYELQKIYPKRRRMAPI